MREALENGEPEDSRCEGCLIANYEVTPELDGLSLSVLAFGAVWDHPAHEGYRVHLWPMIGPALGPADAMRWVARRQAAWNEYEAIKADELKREQERLRNGGKT